MKDISVLFILFPDETIDVVEKLLSICVGRQVDQDCASRMSQSLKSHNLLLLERFYFAAV